MWYQQQDGNIEEPTMYYVTNWFVRYLQDIQDGLGGFYKVLSRDLTRACTDAANRAATTANACPVCRDEFFSGFSHFLASFTAEAGVEIAMVRHG